MQIKEANFIISAVKPDQYPQDDLLEVALAGRSNVGKSSFINRMVQRKALARTSSQPGKTQTLNFYEINKSFRFVDVPGYGYARVSKQSRHAFSQLNATYLSQRPNIALLFLLMDIRHEPTRLDKEMFAFAESLDIPFAVILTKLDKIKRSQVNKHLSMYKKALDLPTTDALFPFSAKDGVGAEAIWQVINHIIQEEV